MCLLNSNNHVLYTYPQRVAVDCERPFTYTSYMSKVQYLKIIEREIHNVNKIIDIKILSGEDYKREARVHKLLLRKIRQHSTHNFFNRLFIRIPQF